MSKSVIEELLLQNISKKIYQTVGNFRHDFPIIREIEKPT